MEGRMGWLSRGSPAGIETLSQDSMFIFLNDPMMPKL
jgi:hypothetical protein